MSTLDQALTSPSGRTSAPIGRSVRRLPSLDILRGAIMVLMALDHTRDYFTALSWDPETLSLTWPSLFITRWVTHFCAPLFFFLAGTGAYFYGQNHGQVAVRRFLWTRGMWLIILEFSVVGAAWTFMVPWGFFGVIWCLGASMVLMSLIVRLPQPWVLWLSIAAICLHDLVDRVRPESLSAVGQLWSLLHARGPIAFAGLHSFVLFPIVPLVFVMGLGFGMGPLFLEQQQGTKRALNIGLLMVLAFVILRATNLYGNPPAGLGGVSQGDWHLQPSVTKTVVLFFDVEKYPPSLQFLLMTLGPALIVLPFLEKLPSAVRRPLEVFGRVPMFFYLLHLYIIHVLAIAVALMVHQPMRWLLKGAIFTYDPPPGYGHNLPFIYLVWAIVLVILYVPCRWFMQLKQRNKSVWLSYL